MALRESESPSHCYLGYGLTLASSAPLPELVPLSGPNGIDIWIRFAEQAEADCESADWFVSCPLPDGSPWLSGAKTSQGYLLRFFGLADFSFDTAGRNICCYPLPQTPPQTLRHLVLDQVLPLVLNLRGQEVLHATAVLTQAGVCAFTGLTGTGKSTLAANFLQAGFAVMSDDCLVIEEQQAQVRAVPAYPGLRLWDDALVALRDGAKQLAPVAHYTTKRRIVATDTLTNFPTQPQPLIRIYALVRQDVNQDMGKTAETGGQVSVQSVQIERLSWQEAYAELLPHLFRFDITDRQMMKRQFEWLAGIIEKVPVSRLIVPAGFERLDAVRAAILADSADLADCEEAK